MWAAISQIIATFDSRLGDNSAGRDPTRSDTVTDFASIFNEADQVRADTEVPLEEAESKLSLEPVQVSPNDSGDVADDKITVPSPRFPDSVRTDSGLIENGFHEVLAPRVTSKKLDPTLVSTIVPKDPSLPGLLPENASLDLSNDKPPSIFPIEREAPKKGELLGKSSDEQRQAPKVNQSPDLSEPSKATQLLEKSVVNSASDVPIDHSDFAIVPLDEEKISPKVTSGENKYSAQQDPSLSEKLWRPQDRIGKNVEVRTREGNEDRPFIGVTRPVTQGVLSPAAAVHPGQLPDRSGEPVQTKEVLVNPIGDLRTITKNPGPLDVSSDRIGRTPVPNDVNIVDTKLTNSRVREVDQRQALGFTRSVGRTESARLLGSNRSNSDASAEKINAGQVLPRQHIKGVSLEVGPTPSRLTPVDDSNAAQRNALDTHPRKGVAPVPPKTLLAGIDKNPPASDISEHQHAKQKVSSGFPTAPLAGDSLAPKVFDKGNEVTIKSPGIDHDLAEPSRTKPDLGSRLMGAVAAPADLAPKPIVRDEVHAEEAVPKQQSPLIPTPVRAEEVVHTARPTKPDRTSVGQPISMNQNWPAGWERRSNSSRTPASRFFSDVKNSNAVQNPNGGFVTVPIQQSGSSIQSQKVPNDSFPETASQEHKSTTSDTLIKRVEREVASTPLTPAGQQSPIGYAAHVPAFATSDLGERQKNLVERSELSVAGTGALSEENGRGEMRGLGPLPSVRDQIPPVVRAITDPLVATLRSGNGISGNEIEVELSPAELGRVRIGFTSTESGLLVTLFADRAETTDMIRRHVSLLTEDLRGMGFDKLSVDVQSGSAGSKQPQQEFGTSQRLARTSDVAEESAQTETNSTPSPTGSDSALDLRL